MSDEQQDTMTRDGRTKYLVIAGAMIALPLLAALLADPGEKVRTIESGDFREMHEQASRQQHEVIYVGRDGDYHYVRITDYETNHGWLKLDIGEIKLPDLGIVEFQPGPQRVEDRAKTGVAGMPLPSEKRERQTIRINGGTKYAPKPVHELTPEDVRDLNHNKPLIAE